jgi:hypothetical protein
MAGSLRGVLGLVAMAGLASAQFPPKPEGMKVLKSKFHENVTISYKEVMPKPSPIGAAGQRG